MGSSWQHSTSKLFPKEIASAKGGRVVTILGRHTAEIHRKKIDNKLNDLHSGQVLLPLRKNPMNERVTGNADNYDTDPDSGSTCSCIVVVIHDNMDQEVNTNRNPLLEENMLTSDETSTR